MGRGPKPTKGTAKPAVSRQSPKSDDARVRDLEKRLAEAQEQLRTRDRELAEALDQQTATSAILSVIATSPTHLKRVLDTLAESAARFCAAYDADIWRLDGDVLRVVGHHGPIPTPLGHTTPVIRGTVVGRSALDRQTVQVTDLQAEVDEFPEGSASARQFGHRSIVSVPLLRDGVPIGAITLRRTEVQPFTEKQIDLLKTFADQAVIAIENVRLFTELQTSNRELTATLDKQTATSDILRVISRSQTDVQPVFDAIVRSAVRLCGASHGGVYRFDGELVHSVAHEGFSPEQLEQWRKTWPRPVRADTSLACEAIRTRRIIRVGDIEATASVQLTTEARANLRSRGSRSVLAVPMISRDAVVGVIGLAHPDVDAFADAHVELLQTFADQAVIAIENVRLFTELQASNRELTTALDTQTATSDILRVISRSQTDVQPVFDAILASAVRLLHGYSGGLTRIEGDQLLLAAITSTDTAADAALRQAFPRPVQSEGMHSEAIRRRAPLNIADAHSDPQLSEGARARARARGYRSSVAVPMLRHDEPLGAIAVSRREPGGFTDDEVVLLQTFADQAVIAIENVQLFTETKERLEQQTATSEILRVISQSPTDVQPVFDAIAENALHLCDSINSVVGRYDGDLLHLAAHAQQTPEAAEALRRAFPMRPSRATASGRAVLEGAVVHIPDVQADPEFAQPLAEVLRVRAAVAVPLMRDGRSIGTIAVGRSRPFSDKHIALLQTFADQAVIAIENVRLFKELQARTGELTRSVGELRALGEVNQALSSTLDVDVVLNTIVTRANDLIGADGCTIFEYDEVAEQFHLRATRNLEPRLVELARGTPLRKGDQGILGQLTMAHQAAQVPDITAGSYSSPISDALIEAGYRAVVAVPLIREGHLIGALTMNRKTPGEFARETIELLQTFATQSALAIQNARLFREIEIKSRELGVASQHKSEFLANMSHELRTPLNAIIGFSEVLGERMFGELNEKQDEYLKDIHASGQHLLSLINDILDLSKIEAGRMELEVTGFDLPMAIDNAMTLIRERAARRSIALHTTVDERLGQVQGDERKIRQVLLNLLSNAIKFTPEGGCIDVEAKPIDGFIQISVSDTGVGIEPEDQEAVFEEFEQVGTADKKVEGTGLGLALSRKFIELHGGKIWVKSQIGQGSTFTFTVPARRGA